MVTNGSQPNKTAINRDTNGKFLPGNCANPNGRPKKELSLLSVLKEELTKIAPLKGNKDKTWIQLIVMAWMVGAAKGNPILIREILDRVDGKVAQPIGLSGKDGGEITLKVVYDSNHDKAPQAGISSPSQGAAPTATGNTLQPS